MAEYTGTNQTIIPGVEVDIVIDPNTGIASYFAIDHNQVDPNNEPVIIELTGSQYINLVGS